MKKFQKKYSGDIFNIARNIIWAQWNRLGLNGTGGINHYSVDIESSIVAASNIALLDGRLHEGLWSWVKHYGHIINAERLSTIISSKNNEQIAHFFISLLSNIDETKWNGVIKRCTKLLSTSSKRNIPLIHTVLKDKLQNPDMVLQNNAIVRYRLLYGTVMRADVLYLLSISHKTKTKREIDFLTSARLASYLGCQVSTIHRIQKDLEHGDFIYPPRNFERNQAIITWRAKELDFLKIAEGYELGIIDWIRINSLLSAAIDLADQLEICENKLILKSHIVEFQKKYFPILCDHDVPMLTEYGNSLGPLEKYSVNELANIIVSGLSTFYDIICNIRNL